MTRLFVFMFVFALVVRAEAGVPFKDLESVYTVKVKPLMKRVCLGCHSAKKKKGELDLERFGSLAAVRSDPEVWQKVREMLAVGEMPPEGKRQPTKAEFVTLTAWMRNYLNAEALANAGDPGKVVLRRLNNAEYTYTIRDLTGEALNPAKDFPAAGAAGEGFLNTGDALVMSTALVRKYLDTGRGIARHVVLLPDGFRFSAKTTRRDWTDEILADIRAIYREHTEFTELGIGATVGNVGTPGNTSFGLAGRLQLRKYFMATLAERAALAKGAKSIAVVARERGLNARYLGTLWARLTADDRSLLLDGLRARWRKAGAGGCGCAGGGGGGLAEGAVDVWASGQHWP